MLRIAVCVACLKADSPIITMYIHVIGNMLALPYIDPETAYSLSVVARGSFGRYGASLSTTPIGPTPGPPPPCGIQNVL